MRIYDVWFQSITLHSWWGWWCLFSVLALLLLLFVRGWVQLEGLKKSLIFRKKTTASVNQKTVQFVKKRFQLWPQKQRQNLQLTLFLRTLGSTLKAGYSVPQALMFASSEAEEPLRSQLSSGVRLLDLKQPLETVLCEWKRTLKIPEFGFLSDTLVLQAHTGGNLIQVCYNVADLVDERQKLERDLKSFTAQGKMSGLLMALLWPISLLIFAWLSPAHTDILFYTPAGQILMGISLLLELVGFFLIWRLIRIKV